MKLSSKLASLEGVNVALHEYYVKNEAGEYLLDAESSPADADTIKTLRTENAGHRTKNRDLTTSWQGLEPQKVREAMVELEALRAESEGRDGKDQKKFDAAVEARIKVLAAPLNAQIAELTTGKMKLEGQVQEFTKAKQALTVREAVAKACATLKCDPVVYADEDSDAILWAERNAEIQEDGSVIDKKSGLGLEAALRALQTSGVKKTWWPPSEGTGAKGSGVTGHTGVNPWAAESWNLSAQGTIMGTDMKLAGALAKQGGAELGMPFHPKNGVPRIQY